jgi:hypothetical protein
MDQSEIRSKNRRFPVAGHQCRETVKAHQVPENRMNEQNTNCSNQQIINFKPTSLERMPVSVGRNGPVKTCGVAIQTIGKELWLQPITSKQSTARCCVALPTDPDVLMKMAAVLLMKAEEC